MTSKVVALAKVIFAPRLIPAYNIPLNCSLLGGGTSASANEIKPEYHIGTKDHHQQEKGFLLFESLVGRKNVLNNSNKHNQVTGEGGTLIKKVTKEYYRSAITGNDKNIGDIILNL